MPIKTDQEALQFVREEVRQGIKDTFYLERPRSIHKRSMWFAIGLPLVSLAGWIVVIIAMHVLKIIKGTTRAGLKHKGNSGKIGL